MMLLSHFLEPAGEPVEDHLIMSQGAVFGRLHCLLPFRAAAASLVGSAGRSVNFDHLTFGESLLPGAVLTREKGFNTTAGGDQWLREGRTP
jgi:hypothetical protein